MKYTKQELEGKAQTVLGPISVDELGITLSHEHCLVDGTCDFVEPKEITEKKRNKLYQATKLIQLLTEGWKY